MISWKSKKQNTVSKSSAEAEYRSMEKAIAQIIWLIGLYEELGMQLKLPVKLYCNSKAALQITANPIYHERTKHIEIECHFIKEKIQGGLICTKHEATNLHVADILAKGLGKGHNMKSYYPS